MGTQFLSKYAYAHISNINGSFKLDTGMFNYCFNFCNSENRKK